MIIKRYLSKQIFQLLAVTMVVLLLVFLSNQFIRYLSLAVVGKVSGGTLLQVLMYEMPHLLGLLLPLGLYLAILLVYGRLYSDSELLILHVSGYSRGQLLKFTLGLASLVFIIDCGLSLWLTPIALQKRDQLLNQVGMEAMLATILPGRFQQSPDNKTVFFTESLSRDHKQMQKVFVAQREQTGKEGKPPRWHIITAESAHQTQLPGADDAYIALEKGQRYSGYPGQNNYQILNFKDYGVRIGKSKTRILYHDADTLSTPTVWQRRQNGDGRVMAELQWRFAMPLSIFALSWLAVGLSRNRPRSGRYNRILPAILVYTLYANFMFVSRAWLQKGTVSPWIGLWWVQVVLLVIACVVWYWRTDLISKWLPPFWNKR